MPFVIRKNIRLPSDHYIGQCVSFVTICCEDRLPIFRSPPRCQTAIEALSASPTQCILWFTHIASCPITPTFLQKETHQTRT
jgi:hypothetical protein